MTIVTVTQSFKDIKPMLAKRFSEFQGNKDFGGKCLVANCAQSRLYNLKGYQSHLGSGGSHANEFNDMRQANNNVTFYMCDSCPKVYTYPVNSCDHSMR